MNAGSQRVAMLRERLEAALSPQDLEIVDESRKHAGHAGAADGRGHFDVLIVAEAFSGKGLLERHRLVYAAVGDAMQTDVHALSIRALTPDEL